EDANVLEIGCGEAGVLKAFCDNGNTCFGIDLSSSRIERGKKLLTDEIQQKRICLYAGDVHDADKFEHLFGQIDLIVLKDAIEHIYDQERILSLLHKFTTGTAAVFLAFPPWLNPFGGHQQLAGSFLKYVPWFHLLPRKLYRGLLKLCGETNTQINVLMEIYETRLSISKFEILLTKTNWQLKKRQFYLFNPGYEVRFGIKPRKQLELISDIPWVRDFFSTAVYYLINERSS
ncbi:class I SAM-dependent methyltransferase, partial [candidate division KSB1 bacterium]|nr:class I SAM-dependent methyltransferase [candidate division KSB1 bacterium]NIR68790.1 class I SAM-dependent methyltransferase [candidate division KSB1 bacterium]NIS28122.1 class I SAM-dependent methyltransferase [candidate division KSB1 bacterium]NIT75018.1 class I SAM-dependent methyltransferase [candidate division KSB1 bacterium]NIU28802.1 class I SAM-dependent methyltransferase [candidate division KSB1 bacterium]